MKFLEMKIFAILILACLVYRSQADLWSLNPFGGEEEYENEFENQGSLNTGGGGGYYNGGNQGSFNGGGGQGGFNDGGNRGGGQGGFNDGGNEGGQGGYNYGEQGGSMNNHGSMNSGGNGGYVEDREEYNRGGFNGGNQGGFDGDQNRGSVNTGGFNQGDTNSDGQEGFNRGGQGGINGGSGSTTDLKKIECYSCTGWLNEIPQIPSTHNTKDCTLERMPEGASKLLTRTITAKNPQTEVACFTFSLQDPGWNDGMSYVERHAFLYQKNGIQLTIDQQINNIRMVTNYNGKAEVKTDVCREQLCNAASSHVAFGTSTLLAVLVVSILAQLNH